MPEEKKNTYITIHKNFVREGIEYTDRKTGEQKSFNSVTLPGDTVIDGQPVGYYQFSPLFVNPSKYRGEDYRDIPLRTDKEVWLRKTVMDENGDPVIGEDGKPEKDLVKVMPEQIKEALDESRKRYRVEHSRDEQSLDSRAAHAREGSQAMADHDVPFNRPAR